MKIILGFIAFILTFGFSTSLVGLLFGFPQPNTASYLSTKSNSQVAQKIEGLLKRDVQNGVSRHSLADRLYQSGETFESIYSDADFRSAALKYVQTSAGMSDADLPLDFQYAWRDHMKAWQKQAAYIRTFENTRDFESDNVSISPADNTTEINETWYQVLRIAQRYGVVIDRSYFQ